MLNDQYAIHETEADRQGERIALMTFRNKVLPGHLLYQGEPLSPIDARAFSGDIKKAILEVKRRRGTPYPTWAIEVQKAQAGWQESEQEGIPFYFIFEWERRYFYLNMTEAKSAVQASRIGYMQRGDRDELPDLCYYVDRKLFTEVA